MFDFLRFFNLKNDSKFPENFENRKNNLPAREIALPATTHDVRHDFGRSQSAFSNETKFSNKYLVVQIPQPPKVGQNPPIGYFGEKGQSGDSAPLRWAVEFQLLSIFLMDFFSLEKVD